MPKLECAADLKSALLCHSGESVCSLLACHRTEIAGFETVTIQQFIHSTGHLMKRTILVFLAFGWDDSLGLQPSHFDRLMQTKRCLECDLSDLNLRNEI